MDFNKLKHIYFLGNVLDDIPQPLYVDSCHLSPEGNEIIAHELSKILIASEEVQGMHH